MLIPVLSEADPEVSSASEAVLLKLPSGQLLQLPVSLPVPVLEVYPLKHADGLIVLPDLLQWHETD